MLNERALQIACSAIVLCALASTAAAPQEIKVTLLGTGTPIVNFNRFGMSTLVEAGSQKLTSMEYPSLICTPTI
jgi:ribonuclease Z